MAKSSVKLTWNGAKFLRKVEQVAAPREVPLDELLPEAWLSAETGFASIDALGEAAGVTTAEELASEEGKAQVGAVLRAHSHYQSWDELIQAAAAEYYRRALK